MSHPLCFVLMPFGGKPTSAGAEVDFDAVYNHLIAPAIEAVERRIAAGKPDYWDYATRLELAVLAKDSRKAKAALKSALPLVREVWEPETTIRNPRLIREARERRQDRVAWANQIEQVLEARTKS